MRNKPQAPGVAARSITITLMIWIALAACGTPAAAPTAAPTELPATSTSTVAPTELPATPTPTAVPTETPRPTATAAEPGAVAQVAADVEYLTPVAENVASRLLDIYAPEAPAPEGAPYPIIVFAHGYGQRKDALVTVSENLAAEGAVVVVPSWPATIPNSAAQWREGAEAIVCAVQYARAYGPDSGGDPDNVILVGFSAGGAFGAHVALAGDDIHERWTTYADAQDGPPQQVACTAADVSPEVQGFVGIGGAYSFADRFATSDPALWEVLMQPAADTDLEIALMQGEFDDTVPPIVAESFHDYLIDQGFAPELIPYNSGHTVPRAETVATVMALAR